MQVLKARQAQGTSAELALMDEHKIELEELCERLNTSPTSGLTRGLSTQQAAASLATNGRNELTPPPQKMCCFKSATDRLEAKKWAYMNRFYPPFTTVLRDGEPHDDAVLRAATQPRPESERPYEHPRGCTSVHPANLTLGDIVHLVAGERIPADLRVLDTTGNCLVDKFSLTRESVPQMVTTECVSSRAPAITFASRPPRVFSKASPLTTCVVVCTVRQRRRCTHDDPLKTANLVGLGCDVRAHVTPTRSTARRRISFDVARVAPCASCRYSKASSRASSSMWATTRWL